MLSQSSIEKYHALQKYIEGLDPYLDMIDPRKRYEIMHRYDPKEPESVYTADELNEYQGIQVGLGFFGNAVNAIKSVFGFDDDVDVSDMQFGPTGDPNQDQAIQKYNKSRGGFIRRALTSGVNALNSIMAKHIKMYMELMSELIRLYPDKVEFKNTYNELQKLDVEANDGVCTLERMGQ